jgi:Pectate lyase
MVSNYMKNISKILTSLMLISTLMLSSCSTTSSDNKDNISKIDFPKGGATVTVKSTIVVGSGKTFDGKGKLYAPSGLGDGSQKENQRPVFILQKGANIKNVFWRGADGIHCYGNNTITNCWCVDVGEDAMTMSGGGVTWTGGGAQKAADKIVQMNSNGTFKFKDLYFEDFQRVFRSNGGWNYKMNLYVEDVTAINGRTIIKIEGPDAKAYTKNIKMKDVREPYQATRGAIIINAQK